MTLKKICMTEGESEENKILIFYRYFSLFVTSFFYFIGNTEHLIQKKLFIIACISVSAVILNFLYIKNENSNKKINVLVLIETLSNSFLLIPSGGINSPYIWYTLNTILITSIKLNKWYCWANLFVYLFSSTVISYLIFGGIELMDPINKEFNLILSLILITAAIQILSKYIKEIKNDKEKLAKINEVNEQLLINEEQNRIANEIHDSVLQRLFSVSCGIFGLMKNIEKLDESKIKEELNTIRDSIDSAMKELRHTIYGLSWEKDGINSFEKDIFEYINQTKKLNNADITFDVTGNMEFLSLMQKKAIYRIICEGIGNAVHHGKADHVSVSLNIEPKNSLLRITDNGKGFNTNEIKNNKGSGLGIKNLYYLTESLNGEINIISKTGIGTEIDITIPNSITVIERKNVV